MIEIVPAILPKSFKELGRKLALIRGFVSTVQVDICDGIFVPSKTWPYTTLSPDKPYDADFQDLMEGKRRIPFGEGLDFEFDLMVSAPEKAAPNFAKFGAARLVIHLNSLKNPIDDLGNFRDSLQKGIQLGLAILPDTPLKRLDGLAETVDFIQVMGIQRIGYQGQQFDEKAIEQVSALRGAYKNLTISVDGGVNLENAPRLIKAGANRLVVGSALFESGDFSANLKKFKDLEI